MLIQALLRRRWPGSLHPTSCGANSASKMSLPMPRLTLVPGGHSSTAMRMQSSISSWAMRSAPSSSNRLTAPTRKRICSADSRSLWRVEPARPGQSLGKLKAQLAFQVLRSLMLGLRIFMKQDQEHPGEGVLSFVRDDFVHIDAKGALDLLALRNVSLILLQLVPRLVKNCQQSIPVSWTARVVERVYAQLRPILLALQARLLILLVAGRCMRTLLCSRQLPSAA